MENFPSPIYRNWYEQQNHLADQQIQPMETKNKYSTSFNISNILNSMNNYDVHPPSGQGDNEIYVGCRPVNIHNIFESPQNKIKDTKNTRFSKTITDELNDEFVPRVTTDGNNDNTVIQQEVATRTRCCQLQTTQPSRIDSSSSSIANRATTVSDRGSGFNQNETANANQISDSDRSLSICQTNEFDKVLHSRENENTITRHSDETNGSNTGIRNANLHEGEERLDGEHSHMHHNLSGSSGRNVSGNQPYFVDTLTDDVIYKCMTIQILKDSLHCLRLQENGFPCPRPSTEESHKSEVEESHPKRNKRKEISSTKDTQFSQINRPNVESELSSNIKDQPAFKRQCTIANPGLSETVQPVATNVFNPPYSGLPPKSADYLAYSNKGINTTYTAGPLSSRAYDPFANSRAPLMNSYSEDTRRKYLRDNGAINTLKIPVTTDSINPPYKMGEGPSIFNRTSNPPDYSLTAGNHIVNSSAHPDLRNQMSFEFLKRQFIDNSRSALKPVYPRAQSETENVISGDTSRVFPITEKNAFSQPFAGGHCALYPVSIGTGAIQPLNTGIGINDPSVKLNVAQNLDSSRLTIAGPLGVNGKGNHNFSWF